MRFDLGHFGTRQVWCKNCNHLVHHFPCSLKKYPAGSRCTLSLPARPSPTSTFLPGSPGTSTRHRRVRLYYRSTSPRRTTCILSCHCWRTCPHHNLDIPCRGWCSPCRQCKQHKHVRPRRQTFLRLRHILYRPFVLCRYLCICWQGNCHSLIPVWHQGWTCLLGRACNHLAHRFPCSLKKYLAGSRCSLSLPARLSRTSTFPSGSPGTSTRH